MPASRSPAARSASRAATVGLSVSSSSPRRASSALPMMHRQLVVEVMADAADDAAGDVAALRLDHARDELLALRLRGQQPVAEQAREHADGGPQHEHQSAREGLVDHRDHEHDRRQEGHDAARDRPAQGRDRTGHRHRGDAGHAAEAAGLGLGGRHEDGGLHDQAGQQDERPPAPRPAEAQPVDVARMRGRARGRRARQQRLHALAARHRASRSPPLAHVTLSVARWRAAAHPEFARAAGTARAPGRRGSAQPAAAGPSRCSISAR